MEKLSRKDLFSLEDYAEKRQEFRAEVMAHKQNRRVGIGTHATLYFEDRLTMQYQIQEMLRVERIFEAAGIEEELQAYNPLIPDGVNLKATFMIEYADPQLRAQQLALLVGIEDAVWIQAGDTERVYPIADEDLERDNAEKTSAVHFLRFEFNSAQINAFKSGEEVSMGIAHPKYQHELVLAATVRNALAQDFS